MWTDSHCHLDYPDFQADLDEVVDRAGKAGVQRLITIGTDLESSRHALSLAEKYEGIYAAIGHHPCETDKLQPDEIQSLAELTNHPKVAALGECGLDYHHLPARSDFDSDDSWHQEMDRIRRIQMALFKDHLEAAEKLSLPVVVHQRESWDDCLELLTPYSGRVRAVFHCFSESLERAMALIERGHLVSFTGILTFKKSTSLRETASRLPPGSYMVETDAPYLAPVPYRGRRCEPSMTADTARVLAECRCISLEALAAEMEDTARGFFRFP
ncbi:MAG: TatD family hydrolase [Candidatus Methylacidiphilales bacterium]